MRLLILIAAVLLAGQAIADNNIEVRVNRIEMKEAVKDEADDATEEKESAPATRAQDYNSSRSNTTSVAALDDDDDGDSVPTDDVCENGVDNDCDSPRDTAPANHNTTRSK